MSNYYNPYFNPMMPVGAYPQPQINLQQPQAQPVTQSLIWVKSRADVESYPLAPNNALPFWNESQPIVYLKSCDATGKATITEYDLVERKHEIPAAPSTVYATKDDLADMRGSIEELRNEIKILKDGDTK